MLISTRAHTYMRKTLDIGLPWTYNIAKNRGDLMSWKIGAPSLKLNNAGVKSKSCGDFRSVAREALEEREGHDPDINKDLAALNEYQGYRTAAELLEYSQDHVDQLRDARGRKLRKDAVVMCATVLKPPAAMMNQLSIEDQKRFLNDAYEVFADIVGSENVKSRADHYDELGAHTHIFWEPMTEDGRLCAKERHNLKFFGRVNRELPERLREKGWDIADCEMYDAAEKAYEAEKQKTSEKKKSGRSSHAFKAEAEREKRALEEQIDNLKVEHAAAEERAQDAQQKAEKAVAVMEALEKPQIVFDFEPKKSLGGKVSLSQEDYKSLHEWAIRGASGFAYAQEMETEVEGLRAEVKRLKPFDPNNLVNRMQQQTKEYEQKKREEELQIREKRMEEMIDCIREDLEARLQDYIQIRDAKRDAWQKRSEAEARVAELETVLEDAGLVRGIITRMHLTGAQREADQAKERHEKLCAACRAEKHKMQAEQRKLMKEKELLDKSLQDGVDAVVRPRNRVEKQEKER